MQRYYNQMQFVSQQMAQMLQTISQGRSNKQITQKDIALVVRAAYLSAYPGTSAFSKNGSGGPFVGPGFPHGQLLYITSDSNGKASIIWKAKFQAGGSNDIRPTNPIAVSKGNGPSNVQLDKSNVDPSELYSGLKMNPGESRLIAEAGIWFTSGGGYSVVGGGTWRDLTSRQAFGFFMGDPDVSKQSSWYFGRTTVFAPRAGLFTDNFPGSGEEGNVSVYISNVGPNTSRVIDVVIDITGLSFKDAEALVNSAPVDIQDYLSQDYLSGEEAKSMKEKLEAAGAGVSLVWHNITITVVGVVDGS